MSYLRFCFVAAVFLTFCNSEGSDNWLDTVIEDLIHEKINDPWVILELQYESSDKVNRVKNNQSEVKNIVLVNFEPNYSNFKVKIIYNDNTFDEIYGIYSSLIEAPVTSRVIKAGEIISRNDITTAKVKINRLRENFLIESNDIIGMQAKRPLSSGILLKNSDLIRPAVIRQNDPVNIIYSSGNIKLKTTGTSIGNGAIGDMIKVKNEDTGTVLLGQIVDKNTVQVGPEK
jgi:flagella basal body P-ring formation protein FlgA